MDLVSGRNGDRINPTGDLKASATIEFVLFGLCATTMGVSDQDEDKPG